MYGPGSIKRNAYSKDALTAPQSVDLLIADERTICRQDDIPVAIQVTDHSDHISAHKYLPADETNFLKLSISVEKSYYLLEGELALLAKCHPILMAHFAAQVTSLSGLESNFTGYGYFTGIKEFSNAANKSAMFQLSMKLLRCTVTAKVQQPLLDNSSHDSGDCA
jgi:hypothetical protein